MIIIIITMCPDVGLILGTTHILIRFVCLHLWAAGGSCDVIENNQQELRAGQNLVITIIMTMIIITTITTTTKIIIWKTETKICVYLAHCLNLPISQIRLAWQWKFEANNSCYYNTKSYQWYILPYTVHVNNYAQLTQVKQLPLRLLLVHKSQ